MGVWDFFKPSVWVLSFPILIVGFLIVVFVLSGSVLSEFGEQACEMKSLFDEAATLAAAGDAEGLQALESGSEELLADLEESKIKFGFVFGSNFAISKADPFYPVPCSIVPSDSCVYYISTEYYGCTQFLIENSGLGELIETGDVEYQGFSYLPLILNLFAIFILVYLLLCVERWLFRLIWPKKEDDF